MRKLLTFLIALIACAGTIFAERVQIGNLYYNLDAGNNTAEVTYQEEWSETNYSYLTAVNIPKSVEYNSVTYTVTSIGTNAFNHCTGLTSITIPNSVTSIGINAFSHCSALTSITIPNSVTSIGKGAFYNCSDLTSIEIPNSVTSIGESAFSECYDLTSIEIPNSVTSIGEGAFYNSSGLTSVTNYAVTPQTINDSYVFYNVNKSSCTLYVPVGSINLYKAADFWKDFTNIQAIADEWDDATKTLTVKNNTANEAYKDQTVIEHVIISSGVTSIGYGAFFGCTGLTSIVVASGNTTYDSRENCNAIIETSSNKLIVGCQNTIIPNSVTSIGVGAFAYCTGLTSITIPNSVTSIGDGTAFYGCTGLTSVTIPNSVTSIGDYTFFGCTGLTSITIPNSVTSIGEWAFASCSGLETVTILAESLESYGTNAFEGTAAALTIYVPAGSVSTYKAGWAAYEDKIVAIVVNPVQIDGLYYNLDADNQTAEVTYQEFMSETNYSYLTTVNIPESVEYNSVTYSVTSIGLGAFLGCTGLTSITIPSSVTSIGMGAFQSCEGLTSITIPNSVESIGDAAFYGCIGLTSVTIGNSVTSIGEGAFLYCSDLASVTINAESLESYGTDAFEGTAEGLKIYVPAGSVATYKAGWADYEDKIVAIPGGDEPATQEITPNVDPQNASVYYSTFYDSAKKYELPAGVEAYVADLSGSDLVLTKIAGAGQVIPNDVAVILRSSVDQFTLTASVAIPVSFTANNDLEGSDDAISAPSNCYVLSGHSSDNSVQGVGFYQFTGTLTAHKAYVLFSGSNAPRRMRFVYNEAQVATGVTNTNANANAVKRIENGQLIIIRNGEKFNAQGQIVK